MYLTLSRTVEEVTQPRENVDRRSILGSWNLSDTIGSGSSYSAFNGQTLGRSALHRPKLETTVGADGGAYFRPQCREHSRQSQ